MVHNELGTPEQMVTIAPVPLLPSSRSWLVAILLAFVGGAGLEAAPESGVYSARPGLAQVVLGGRLVNLQMDPSAEAVGETNYRGISLLPGELPLEIRINTAPPGVPPVVRLRSRLEGREEEWQDHDGVMWLVLRFLDDNNRAVSSASFTRTGESLGWGGLPQNSRLHPRVDESVVPERSSKVQILLVSGGTPRTTGFWAVRRLRLTASLPGEGAALAKPIFQLETLRGQRLESPLGNPDGWVRDGTGLSTPRIHTHVGDDGVAEPLLALVDGDPTNTGGWLQPIREATPVLPGQRLRLECEEMFSIGRGGDAALSFHTLPVGKYVFRVWATDELGRPTGPSLRLPLEVRPPFYAALWFRFLGFGLVVFGLLGGFRYFAWRRLQRELHRLERRRAVEEERTRIARDIHDEMGSRFTQISLLAGRALMSAPADEAVREPIRKINGAVKELASALEEIVWAANPLHDTLEGFSNYLSQYAGAVLRDADLRCRLDIPILLPSVSLSSGKRHRLMMAVKEALNNALKHGAATEVRVKLEFNGNTLLVWVVDNGCGFDPATVKRGNGLDHLARRMEETGGACAVESLPGAGTRVRLSVPLPVAGEAV